MASVASVIEDQNDWTVACDVQQRFMRPAAPALAAVDSSAQCRQLHSLGGDCYDFVPLSENRLAFTIGDASGKGLAAALMIASVQSSLRTAAQFTSNNIPATVAAVNRHVHATSLTNHYATLFYGVFDATAGALHYVNAGHNPPIVLRRDGSIEWLETGGAPVGMFPDWQYEEGSVELHSGDVVLASTDGIIEAENPSAEMWGVAGLQQAAAQNRTRSAAEMVDAIFEAMHEFTRGCQADDATVMVLRVR